MGANMMENEPVSLRSCRFGSLMLAPSFPKMAWGTTTTLYKEDQNTFRNLEIPTKVPMVQ